MEKLDVKKSYAESLKLRNAELTAELTKSNITANAITTDLEMEKQSPFADIVEVAKEVTNGIFCI
jgi:hypothetical protein